MWRIKTQQWVLIRLEFLCDLYFKLYYVFYFAAVYKKNFLSDLDDYSFYYRYFNFLNVFNPQLDSPIRFTILLHV